MKSDKILGVIGAALTATASTFGASSKIVVQDEASHTKPDATPKPKRGRPAKHVMKSGKTAPSAAQIRKMTPEKAAYWNDRKAKDAMPSFWAKKRNVQARGGNVKAGEPLVMTRQVRRARERKELSQPIRMSASEWNAGIQRERRETRLERKAQTA